MVPVPVAAAVVAERERFFPLPFLGDRLGPMCLVRQCGTGPGPAAAPPGTEHASRAGRFVPAATLFRAAARPQRPHEPVHNIEIRFSKKQTTDSTSTARL